MSRKPAIMDRLKVENFGEVELRMDKKTGTWEAEVAGKLLTDPTKSGLEEKVKASVKIVLVLDWIPVIEIGNLGQRNQEDDDRDETDAEVRLKLKRFWAAKKPTGGWVTASWEAAAYKDTLRSDQPAKDMRASWSRETNLDFAKLDHPIVRRSERSYYRDYAPDIHLPYTDERWSALREIQKRIIELDRALAKLAGSRAGMELLSGGSAPLMLTAPDVIEDEPAEQ